MYCFYLIFPVLLILNFLITSSFSGSLSLFQYSSSKSKAEILLFQLKDRTLISASYVNIEGRIVLANPLDACESIQPPPTSLENWILLTKLDDFCGLGQKIKNAADAGYHAIIAKNTGANDTGLYWIPTDTTSNYGHRNNLIYVGVVGESDGIRLETYSFQSLGRRYYLRIQFQAKWSTVFYLILIGGSLTVIFVAGLLLKLFFLNNIAEQASQVYPTGMERYHPVRRVLQQKVTGVRLHQIPVRKWSQTMDSYSDACAICLCGFNDGLERPIRVFGCFHAFHACCVDPWILKEKTRCPVCMKSVFSKSTKQLPSIPSTFTNV